MAHLSRRRIVSAIILGPITSHAIAQRTATNAHCSGGWKITGYYTATDTEFSGESVDIEIDGKGYIFPEDFLHWVRTDGWGLTHHGWYLGWNGGWRRGDAPLNARGQPLVVGGVAVDPKVIPLGTRLRMPDLPAPWNAREYIANDIGGGVIGKWLDVYCGDGPDKRQEAIRLTGSHYTVCVGAAAA